jgi:GTP-binding protein EngB required for normal cell division
LCLEKHPLLTEKASYRLKYLNALSYFIEKYAYKDKISSAMFKNYKNAFLHDDVVYVRVDGEKNLSNIKNLLRYRFRRFKFFSFRYVLLCDLVMLISPDDESKSREIAGEIKNTIKKPSRKNIDSFLQLLYHAENNGMKFWLTEYHLDYWKNNNTFLQMPSRIIMISSNMSSGKSTLINALAGKRINRSMNEACTSKLHYINDKPFEDNYIYEYDYNLDMNADIETLMEDNEKNKSNFISIASYFRHIDKKGMRLCLVDSPGVNNSLDKTQEEIKRLIVSEYFDIFLYVINAEYIGTTDDFIYLQYIKQNIDGRKVVFILNKLDRFRLSEDSIEESVGKLRERMIYFGFENPIVCPISAYAALLAKRKMFDDDLSESNIEEYELLSRKFKRKEYDLSKYYTNEINGTAKRYVENAGEEHNNEVTLLYNSGVLCLETMLYQGGNR